MTDYKNQLLIELLKEKVRRLENEKESQRKEINRLKKEVRELRKGAAADEK